MFGILGKIFGSSSVIEKAGSLIDEAFYTDSEKAEDKMKATQMKAQHRLDLMKSYEPFKLAQRYIAFGFVFVFLFIMLNGVVGALYGLVDMENVEQARKFADDMWLGQIIMMIVSFYFGGGLVESLGRNKKDNFHGGK
jgi:hypothetical protein